MIEQLGGVDRIVRRTELAGLDGVPQPDPLVGHEDVVVIVAGRRTIDLAKLGNRFQGVRRPRGGRPRNDRCRQRLEEIRRQPVRLRRQRRIADRIMEAERIEVRGEMSEAANRFGEVETGDAGLENLGRSGPAIARNRRIGRILTKLA